MVSQVDIVAVQSLSYLITIDKPLSPQPTFSSHGFPGTEAPYHLLVNKHFPLAHKPLCNSDILQLHRFQSNNQQQTYNPNRKRYDIRFSDPTHARWSGQLGSSHIFRADASLGREIRKSGQLHFQLLLHHRFSR